MKITKLKTSSKNFFIKIALVILLATFLLGGVLNLFFTSNDYPVIIGNKKFSFQELNEFKAYEIKAIEDQIGRDNLNLLNKNALNSMILSKFIDQKLIAKLADDFNIIINDQFVKSWVINSGFFSDKDKKFSKEKYFELLKLRKISEKEFLKSIKDYLKRKTIVDLLNEMDFENKLLKDEERKHRNLKSNFTLIKIKEMPQNFAVSTEEIAEFYKQNKEKYLTAETRDITYLMISENDFINDIQITDAEALIEYNNNYDKNFNLLEFNNELEAKAYISQSKISKDNSDIAVKLTELKNEELTVIQNKLTSTLSKENVYSKPYYFEGKWLVLKVQYKDKNIPTFAEIKKEIKDNMTKEQVKNKLSNKATELTSSEILQSLTMEEIAKNYGWKIGKITNICNSCSLNDDQYKKLNEKLPTLTDIVFESEAGKISALEESIDSSSFISVRVDKIKESKYLEIEEVTPEIKKELKKQKFDDFLMEKSKEYLDYFQNNETNLQNIYSWLRDKNIHIDFEKELTSQRFEYLENIQEKNLSDGLLRTAFVTKPNHSNWYYDNQRNEHFIVLVNKFFENINNKDDSQEELISNKAYEELMIYLSKYYNVTVNNVFANEN